MPAYSTEQPIEVAELLREVTSVELKVSVPDTDRRSAVAALGIDPSEGRMREAVFFDTHELTLRKRGILLGVERTQDSFATSAVRLRPVVPENLPVLMRKSPNFSLELDATTGGFACSAAMTNRLDPAKVADAVADDRPLRKLFSREQRNLMRAYAPHNLWFRKLHRLGPIMVVDALLAPVEFAGRRFAAELWTYPDSSRILALSMPCAPAEAFAVATQVRVFLARHGIDPGAAHHATTAKALEFFANEIVCTDGDRVLS